MAHPGWSKDQIKEMMKRILTEYVKVGVIGLACDNAGVRRKYHYQWCEEYPAYKERFEELREKFVDGLESVAIQRAKEKSDSLLILMLKAHRREVYGDKSDLNIAGQHNAPPIQLVFAEGMLSPDEKKLLGGGDDGSAKVDEVLSSEETS